MDIYDVCGYTAYTFRMVLYHKCINQIDKNMDDISMHGNFILDSIAWYNLQCS